MIFLDIETTGVDSRTDEILEIAAFDYAGMSVFHSYIQPVRVKEWPKAQLTHGLSPAFIFSPENNFPTLEAVAKHLDHVLDGEFLVTYNAKFDVPFLSVGLHNAGLSTQPWRESKCCMLRYADHVKAPKDKPYYQGNYKNWKLTDAAKRTGYYWGADQPHGARGDAHACRHVWLWLNQQQALGIASRAGV